MNGFTATHVGVDTRRPASHYTCTRCGIVKKVNIGGGRVAPNRDTYRCQDCITVLALDEA